MMKGDYDPEIETMIAAGYHINDRGDLLNGKNKIIQTNEEFFDILIKRANNKKINKIPTDYGIALKELNVEFPGIRY